MQRCGQLSDRLGQGGRSAGAADGDAQRAQVALLASGEQCEVVAAQQCVDFADELFALGCADGDDRLGSIVPAVVQIEIGAERLGVLDEAGHALDNELDAGVAVLGGNGDDPAAFDGQAPAPGDLQHAAADGADAGNIELAQAQFLAARQRDTVWIAGTDDREVLENQRREMVEFEILILQNQAAGRAGAVDADALARGAAQAQAVAQVVVARQQADADVAPVVGEQGAQGEVQCLELAGDADGDAAATALSAFAQRIDGLLDGVGLGGQQVGAVARVVGDAAGQRQLGAEMDGQIAARDDLPGDQQFGAGVLKRLGRIGGERPGDAGDAIGQSVDFLDLGAVRQQPIAYGKAHLCTGHRKLAVGDADLQRAGQGDLRRGVGRIGLDALTVAADVVKLGQFGQAGEQRAAVGGLRCPHARLEFEQRQAREGAQHAGRGDESRLARLARPLDIGGGGARRDQPVVADAVGAGGELQFDAVLRHFVPAAIGIGDGHRLQVGDAIPAANARIGREQRCVQGMADARGQVDDDDIALGAQHLHQRAGLAEQFVAVVDELDPAAGGDRQHIVAADAGDLEFVGDRVVQPAHDAADDAAVVARPLVAGLPGDAAVVMDLDAIKVVFEQPVAGFRWQLARRLGRNAGFGTGGKTAVGSCGQRLPGGDFRQAGQSGV